MKFTKYVYSLTYKDTNNHTIQLRYRIIDSPVTKLWIQNVTKTLRSIDYAILEIKNPIGDIQESLSKLKKYVEDVNSQKFISGYNIEIEQGLEHKNIRQYLNILHTNFHEIMESENFSNSVLDKNYDPVKMINEEVHRAETILDNRNNYVYFGSSLHYNEFNFNTEKIHLDMDLLKYWDYEEQHGDLLLGYDTVGKNLYHCFLDNDIDVVKNLMIRPQIEISTQTISLFGFNRPLNDIERTKTSLRKWVNDHALDKYVNMNDLRNLIVGQPLLGKLIKDVDMEVVHDLVNRYKLFKVELEENELV